MNLTPGELRELLRDHALIVAPGELLVVMTGDHLTPWQIRELSDALNAVCSDPYLALTVVC